MRMQFDAALVAAFLAICVPVRAADTPPPIEHYVKRPAIDNVIVSPSGRRMAVTVFSPDGYRHLAVMDLDPIGEARIVAGFNDADVTRVHWVNDDRLIYEGAAPFAQIRIGEAGLFAVNHDGSGKRTLVSLQLSVGNKDGGNIVQRILPYGWFFHSTIDDGSDDVFMTQAVWDRQGDVERTVLARLDTRTGIVAPLSYGMPEGVVQWWLDARYEPRLAGARAGGRTKLHWRAPGSEGWTEVANFDPLREFGFVPQGIDADGQILVLARRASDMNSLHRFDPVRRQVEAEPLAGLKGFDAGHDLIVDRRTRRAVGMHLAAGLPTAAWFVDPLASLQASIDAALPKDRSNLIHCGRCESSRFFVVHSMSDRHPGEYYLFDREKVALSRIGASRPWIDEKAQGRRSFHRYTARDGLAIPIYVTHPPGARDDTPLPTIVLVHGGPWTRGSDLGWDASAQFLASRGYRVLQPEFRGSEGYGFKHFKAGWKQWGLAMQDDLADAVQWAASNRLSDPERACIVGGSYGGYAALMAPITHPATWRCAASFAGITDIDLLYDISWSDTSQAVREHGMPVLIGDPVKDASQLARASPLRRAAEIKVPVLLGHGAADRRVPIDHARRFVDAARRGGVEIDAVYYNGVGHGFVEKDKEADWYGRLERFLAKTLQAPPR